MLVVACAVSPCVDLELCSPTNSIRRLEELSISFALRTFCKAEVNYSQLDEETAAIMLDLKGFYYTVHTCKGAPPHWLQIIYKPLLGNGINRDETLASNIFGVLHTYQFTNLEYSTGIRMLTADYHSKIHR